ncbi:MAG: hypothetical protein H7644_14375 [Candidatus Heimdallarchaeota archaeon]|nr:hypothetical protein [Candidatus Heimdallarchaeota archaeon]
MSKFLIVHMNKGVYDTIRILEESTVQLMHTPVHNNWGLGWDISALISGYEGFWTGPWIGATIMITKANLGLVVFTNQGLWEEGYMGKTLDIIEYIANTAKELIPIQPTKTNLEILALPVLLAVIGTVLMYSKRNKD